MQFQSKVTTQKSGQTRWLWKRDEAAANQTQTSCLGLGCSGKQSTYYQIKVQQSGVDTTLLENIQRKTEASTDFVEGLQVSDGWGDLQVVWKFILQVGDQHPELGAPVPHVVQPANVRIITQTVWTLVWNTD